MDNIGNNISRNKPKGVKASKSSTRKRGSIVPTSYKKNYEPVKAVHIKSTTSVKKIKKGDKEFELITVTAEDTAENNSKYSMEGFEKKAGITRSLRGGQKSVAVWTLLKPVASKKNVNDLSNMLSGLGFGKIKSPSPVRVANVQTAVQEEVDDALTQLVVMFSSKTHM